MRPSSGEAFASQRIQRDSCFGAAELHPTPKHAVAACSCETGPRRPTAVHCGARQGVRGDFMGGLADRAFAVDALRAAWSEVLANDREDGVMSAGAVRFLDDEDQHLEELAAELAEGTYAPGELTPVTLASETKVRQLHVPRLRDRVVARAVLDVVTPLIDPVLGPSAYAYRPGLGVADAVQAVAALRAEGLSHVLRTDVRDCFPNLPKDAALRRFRILIEDDQITTVVEALLGRVFRAPTGGLRTLEGVAQGCPLSPLMANLVLVDLDRGLLRAGFPTVRYGDDLLVAAASASDALEAARLAATLTKALGMELNSDKTKVTSFEEGFTFLGEDFGPRFPPSLTEHRVQEPTERVLYVGHQGGRVRISDGRVIVESADDAQLLDVPSSQVARLVCFGSVGVSAGIRSWALANEVDVVFASRKGNYLGTMLSHGDRYRPARLRAQLGASDGPLAVTLGRAIVHAKISKQQVLLERLNRRPHQESVTDAVGQLEALLAMIPDASTPMELMGLEGASARFYFPCLGQLLPEPMRFVERSRQPPQDIVNAALSYLYTILLGECVTALHAAGLDPAFGMLHSDQDNRPSLALDLMEEFRPWLVDQVVAEAALRDRFRPEHGRREEGRGVLLTKEGKEVVVDAYERRLLGEVRGALPDFAGSRRRHLYRQAQRLRAAIQDGTDWTGLSWRP